MRNAELSRQILKLRNLSKKSAMLGGDIEMMSHWSRYLCVQSAGLIENAIKELYGEYTSARSSENVSNFVESKLARGKNPNANNLLEVAGMFSPTWRQDLDVFISQNGRKEAIDAVMSNRHQIAHGGNTGITIARVNGYLDKIIEVLEFIETQLV